MKHKSSTQRPVKPDPEKGGVDYEFFTSEAEVMNWIEANLIELFAELDKAEADAERRDSERG